MFCIIPHYGESFEVYFGHNQAPVPGHLSLGITLWFTPPLVPDPIWTSALTVPHWVRENRSTSSYKIEL